MAKDSELLCEFHSLEALYLAYMPFVENGALFVHYGRRESDKLVTLGAKLSLAIKLPESDEIRTVSGKVVWISQGEMGEALKGFGVQFSQEDSVLRDQIDALLKEYLVSGDATRTL